jgi:hypothetical protein
MECHEMLSNIVLYNLSAKSLHTEVGIVYGAHIVAFKLYVNSHD